MNVLVTGGSRGLGLEIVRRELESGNQVFIVSRTCSQELGALREQYPDSCRFLACDLSQPEEVKQQVFDVFGNETPIDGMVSNAAIAYDDLISNLDIERVEDTFSVNVFSPMVLTKYAIRNMLLHKRRGSIVHVSSISAHTGYKGLAMYAATKGAIEAFSKNTAREWGSMGIRSNCVVPGFMQTDMSASLSAEQMDRIRGRTALKQNTSPQSVAETIHFLLSDASCSITGQNVFVDSGTI